MRRLALVFSAFLTLGACGPSDDVGEASGDQIAGTVAAYDARAPLPDYFDCVREAGGVLIAAHRGGPAPGYPENALETLEYGLSQGITVFEIDVTESRDGVQFLMHDRTLGRTTTGSGAVADTDWSEISRLKLIDNAGTRTNFAPPRFTDVLLWAKESGAILEVDRKLTTSFRNVISNVRAAGAEDYVILISYNDDQAAEIARLAPELMLTASARGGRDIAALEARGVDREKLIAWTGTDAPDAAAWSRVLREDVEPAFGTLGRPGERLDDAYSADGDYSDYAELIEDGLVLLATDVPYEVASRLRTDDQAYSACGR